MTSCSPAGESAGASSDDKSALLARVLDAIPSAIGFWTADLRNVFANRAYFEWFGMTPQQLRGKHARTMLGAELFDLNMPYIERALAGERQVFERELHTPAGETREAQIEYIPYVSDGKVGGVISVVVDVSQRIHAERAARSAAAQVATLTERQRIEERAHEGILQDLFAVQLRIERARAAVAGDSAAAGALDAALERLDVAVADLRLVLATETTDTPERNTNEGTLSGLAIASGRT